MTSQSRRSLNAELERGSPDSRNGVGAPVVCSNETDPTQPPPKPSSHHPARQSPRCRWRRVKCVPSSSRHASVVRSELAPTASVAAWYHRRDPVIARADVRSPPPRSPSCAPWKPGWPHPSELMGTERQSVALRAARHERRHPLIDHPQRLGASRHRRGERRTHARDFVGSTLSRMVGNDLGSRWKIRSGGRRPLPGRTA